MDLKGYVQQKISRYLKSHPKVAFGIVLLIIILALMSS